MKDQLKALHQIETLRSLKSQKKLAQITAEEQELRRQVNVLNEHRKAVHSTDTSLVPMRAIGADILWQGWIDRTQAELNTQLARLLAKKEPVVQATKRDISRRDISELIASEAAAQLHQEKETKALNQVTDVAVSQRAVRKNRPASFE